MVHPYYLHTTSFLIYITFYIQLKFMIIIITRQAGGGMCHVMLLCAKIVPNMHYGHTGLLRVTIVHTYGYQQI